MRCTVRSNEVLGFVGLGAMGRPMAEHLRDAGFPLVVHDVSAAASSLSGVTVAATPAEVADRADVVFLCLPDAHAVREVVLGPQGLRLGERMSVLVHTGTSGAPVVQEMASALATVSVVDAPVTGGVPRARAGSLTAIVAGPVVAVERVRPYLDAFATKVAHVSANPGDAQRMKLVNNFLSAGNLALACEAMVLGQKLGLDPKAIVDVVNSGSGQNSATLTKIPENVIPRKFSRGGAIGMLLKDLREAEDEARANGVETPLGDAVRAVFARAIAEGSPRDDSTSVICHMERAAGLHSHMSAED
ncbi:NAD(P)-dependent oxidoreductase [Microbispora sp. H13382]|uniref:NAD(P)-dependent oxidoreductase n=1 Tax=Microbispora sp. H13382 TaxID=2729112 RepID=UPI002175D3ED|nr:NAD(P)-dependent oxidoreductase [Microbispora sp. H13382]